VIRLNELAHWRGKYFCGAFLGHQHRPAI